MSSYIILYVTGDRMEIRGITPVLCDVCGKSTGEPDCGALSGCFSGKKYHLQLCQACFLALIGAAKEMRRVNVMFAASDMPSDNFGLKHEQE